VNNAPGKQSASDLWLPVVAAAYVAWNARDVASAWLHSPFDRFGWLAALIWISPAVRYFARNRRAVEMGWIWAGVVATLAGSLADLNVLKHAGLALAAAALPARNTRPAWAFCLWLASAPCWMPALGWALKSLGPPSTNGVRLALSLFAAAMLYRKTP
jgi:hypothetical protein